MYNNGMQLFHKKSTFYFLLAGTCIMIVVMYITGKPLNTIVTPSGILHLEFANLQQKTEQVLNAWKDSSTNSINIISAAKTNTWFDFLFLLFYSSFLFCSCKLLARALYQHKSFSKLINFFSVLALITGFLDIIENIGMLVSLADNVSDRTAFITSFSSIVKWILVIMVLLSIISSLTAKFILKRKLEWV